MTKRIYVRSLVFIFAIFLLIPSILSTETRFWTLSKPDDFKQGTLRGISIIGSGGIALAPKVVPMSGKSGQSSVPFFWCQAVDSSDNVYIGSGNGGIILKVSRDGRVSTFFRSEELEVTALAVDSGDNIYAGTSPQGRIYRISKNGDPEIFCEPEERYIWALAFDLKGNLFAATGERGLILKVLKNGEYKVFFDSDEPHIVSLSFDAKGNLLAGSGGKGIIYRFAPDGKGEALFSTGMQEVSSIAALQNGMVFFSAITKKEAEPGAEPLQLVLRELISSAQMDRKIAESTVEEEDTGKKFAATIEGFPLPEKQPVAKIPLSIIYAISPDDEVERLLALQHEHVFSLCAGRDGKIYAGTGEPGMFYRLEEKGQATLLTMFNEAHVTSIVPMRSSELSLITSNMGKAYRFSPELENTGVFISKPFDAGMKSEWGKLSCVLEHGDAASIEIYTRSGNTKIPDTEWSEWSTPYTPYKNEKIQSPPARFLQVKIHFSSTTPANSAVLKSVIIPYLHFNEPPEIKNLSIVRPGQKRALNEAQESEHGSPVLQSKETERDEIAIAWESSDPNGDDLHFTLSCRAEKQNIWTEIGETINASHFLWKPISFPDGKYSIKVKADDSRSNFNGEEKYAELTSDPIIIDTTPPDMNIISKSVDGNSLTIAVSVRDATGIIQKLLFSTDQKSWTSIRPDDRICDSSEERFTLSVEPKEGAPLFLKCIDSSLNESMLEIK